MIMMSDWNGNGDDDVQYIEEDKEYVLYIYIDDDNDDNDVK